MRGTSTAGVPDAQAASYDARPAAVPSVSLASCSSDARAESAAGENPFGAAEAF